MEIRSKSITRRILSVSAIGVGILLFLADIAGLFHYTTIGMNHKGLLDTSARTVSEKEFWDKAYKRDYETVEEYVARLTRLVSDRMLFIDPKYAKPTFFENWILWAWAQIRGEYEWADSKRAVRLGGGFCSQHAIVFYNILDEQGIESRILGLSGHMLNEVLIEGTWRVYDPDYNVVFDASLNELQNNPHKVYHAYRDIGHSEEEAEKWQKIFQTKNNNRRFSSSKEFAPEEYFIEKASFVLIWLIPTALILSGLLSLKKSH